MYYHIGAVKEIPSMERSLDFIVVVEKYGDNKCLIFVYKLASGVGQEIVLKLMVVN